MSIRCETNLNKSGNPRIIGRNDLLFIGAAIAVAAGLLFPPSAHILDVLLIFSVSLTAAVLIITFSAHSVPDVSGFPLLIVLTTMLRVALSAASTKLILSQDNTSTIISIFGSIIVGNNVMLAILIFGTLTAVVFGTICKAAKGISRTASEFTSDIVPIKQISVDSDLNAGVINKSQAFELREKIAREAGFFAAMGGTARFILCAAVIELAIAVVNIVGGMAAGTISGATAGLSVKTYTTLAVGAGMTTQIPALLVAVASIYLVRKSSPPPAANDEPAEQDFAKRIKVVANEVTPSQAIELQYGNIEAEQIVCEELEWSDEPRCMEDEKENDDLNLWVWEEIKDSDCYDAIAELIESKSDNETKTILMAAESVEELPVTVPVNIAMRLAQREKRCLLIDLDLERDAIAKVFDIDSAKRDDKAQKDGIETCISNLYVWPASQLAGTNKDNGESNTKNIKHIITRLESRYDRLIVYAPNVKLLADSDKIAGRIRAAMLFGREGESESSAISDFHKLLIGSGCAIFEPREVLAEVV